MAKVTVFDVFRYMGILMPLIADAEAIHGPGTGPEKRQRVVKAFQDALRTEAAIAEPHNPEYVKDIESLIDTLVAASNKWAAATPNPALPVIPSTLTSPPITGTTGSGITVPIYNTTTKP